MPGVFQGFQYKLPAAIQSVRDSDSKMAELYIALPDMDRCLPSCEYCVTNSNSPVVFKLHYPGCWSFSGHVYSHYVFLPNNCCFLKIQCAVHNLLQPTKSVNSPQVLQKQLQFPDDLFPSSSQSQLLQRDSNNRHSEKVIVHFF